MSKNCELLEEELSRWGKGVIGLAGGATRRRLGSLCAAVDAPLPEDYLWLLARSDGIDLRGDRLLAVDEVLAQLEDFPGLLAAAYRDDPDWPSRRPPTHLVPIAQDLEGNLLCLDLSTTPAEVVDWHRETCEFTTWHSSVSSWLLTRLGALCIRFDYKGRPRPIRAHEASELKLREIGIHLEWEPRGAFPLLERANWLAENGTPEDALFAYRGAAEGRPARAMNHYRHARWALLQGRGAEARSALRRCLAVEMEPNPRKHSFRSGYLPAAQTILGVLYDGAGQKRKAEEAFRTAERTTKRYGFDWYRETAEYQEMLTCAERSRG